jgi:hypothetical protein
MTLKKKKNTKQQDSRKNDSHKKNITKKSSSEKKTIKKQVITTKKSRQKENKSVKNSLSKKENQGEKKRKKKVKLPIVKKSLTTARFKKNTLKTPYLTVALFISILAVLIIFFILIFQSGGRKNLPTPPIAHHLSVIDNPEIFFKVKNSLMQNLPTTDGSPTECLGSLSLTEKLHKEVVAHNKFLIILKRGKLFVTNTSNNKFIGSIEISPYPDKEKDAIIYNDIFLKDNKILVTGYRTQTKSVEITTFKINTYGLITRGSAYNLPSSNCNFGSTFDNGNLFIYSTTKLTAETTLPELRLLNEWDAKLRKFTKRTIENSKLFYDNASLLDNPIFHTLTKCTVGNNSPILNCQQLTLLADATLNNYWDNNILYLWTTKSPKNITPSRVVPNSKLHQIDLNNMRIEMVQVEGLPISRHNITLNDTTLSSTIYQNAVTAPAWHTNFKSNKIAHFTMDLNEFKQSGKFINDADSYNLTLESFDNVKKNIEVVADPKRPLVTTDTESSTIQIYNPDRKSFFVDGKILHAKKIPTEAKILTLYSQGNSIIAQTIDTNSGITSAPLILKNNHATISSIESSVFLIDDKIFISTTIFEDNPENGSLYLILLSNNNLSKLYQIIFNKINQRISDGCQNDCQDSWKKSAHYFSFGNTSKLIYATVGSKLKKLVLNNTNNTVRLVRTIDYTYKPAPPKPKRPTARIPGGAKVVNGKYVCKKKKGYVGKSKKNNKGYLHLDMECCLDPDEYPNPWCTYRPGELGVTKLHYKDYHGKKKIKKH